jgi:hypothetical protein
VEDDDDDDDDDDDSEEDEETKPTPTTQQYAVRRSGKQLAAGTGKYLRPYVFCFFLCERAWNNWL